MQHWRCSVIALVLVAGCDIQTSLAENAPTQVSGINQQELDPTVRAQDDPYQYVNGRWLASFEIPADKGRYNQFSRVDDTTQVQLHALVDDLQSTAGGAGPDQQKLADLYASFMGESALEPLGITPLARELARIDAIKNRNQIPALIAHLNRIGVPAPYTAEVQQDSKDAARYVAYLQQDGLGMPDRDYYLQNDSRIKQIRGSYLAHTQKVLALAGDKNATTEARDIMALETALAKVQWTKVENRDPIKVYNKVGLPELVSLAVGYNWNAYLNESGFQGKINYLIVSQPSYISGFNKLLRETPLSIWKSYFRLRVLKAYAPYLGKAFVDENFAFDGMVLQGTEENEARWKRGVHLLDRTMGEALGQLYVAKYFPPAYKERMDQLVKSLLAAYEADIGTLDWMGQETKHKALEKLALFTTKIGYPTKMRDYGALQIVRSDLVGNVVRANEFEYQRNLNKLGQAIDRAEWGMTAPTVNAYYNPALNEIVFPAGILQPPFFNANADDAVNYGAIGAVIGHEISHGFDDEGSQYDGHGNLLEPPGWFTQADLEHFKKRTQALIEQYSAISPIPGYAVNGELTLGENIADNSGLAIAYKAYELSLGGKPAPIIDGLTGAQRFYLGFAQVWRAKIRDNDLIRRIKTDPHSPDRTRGTLPLRNQAGFYSAFDVKEGDRMYLPSDKRVSLW